jgi:hypothetical protein
MTTPAEPNAATNPACTQPGRFNAISGRFSVEPTGDDEYYRRPFGRKFERNYDATGAYYPLIAVAPANAWQKGELMRRNSPVLKLTYYGPMYDPTNPATWSPGL